MAGMGEPRHNEYWRIGDIDADYRTLREHKVDVLATRHYKASKTWSNDKLQLHLNRCARGLLSYYAYTTQELLEFMANRRLSSTRSRGDVLGTLESADHSLQFHGFSRLPTELRCRIYTMYFEEFDAPLRSPVQPPLTLTSSPLRWEALPLFYGICTFQVLAFQRYTGEQARPYRTYMACDSLLWISSLNDESLSKITKVNIVIATPPRNPAATSGWLHKRHQSSSIERPLHTIRLQLPAGKESLITTDFGCNSDVSKQSPTKDKSPEVRVRLARIRMVTDAIQARNTKPGLVKEDFFALRRAIEDIRFKSTDQIQEIVDYHAKSKQNLGI